MSRVLILGSTGMLGHAVNKHFGQNKNFEISTTSRIPGDDILFDVLTDSVDALPKGFDYVINCIGVIKPYVQAHPLEAVKVNAVFPLELAKFCRDNNMRLIHITTDCVYSGAAGRYTESSPHDALDAYGKSKSLGECVTDAMVLRTSIIGTETNGFVSLVSWAQSQAGQTVEGYVTHLWNGVTAGRYAKVCEQIIQGGLYQKGLWHIYARNDVSKYQLLHYLDRAFNLNLTILEAYPEKIDRTLRSEKPLCAKLDIPTVEQMISEMRGE